MFLTGCDFFEYDRICKEIYQPTLNMLDFYKNVTREQSKELAEHEVRWISPENFLQEIERNCLLIVTNGGEPQQNEWHTENSFTQFDIDKLIPVRTWNLTSDQIEGRWDRWNNDETDGRWKYWIICD